MAKLGSNYSKTEEDYQAESDLRTLIEAEKIEKDPKRFKAARECAKLKLEAMMAIASEKD